MTDKRLKASAAVEASFTVPFMFFVTLVLIVFIFMLYNRMKLTGNITEMLEYARAREKTKGSVGDGEMLFGDLLHHIHGNIDANNAFCITEPGFALAPLFTIDRMVFSFMVYRSPKAFSMIGYPFLPRLLEDLGENITDAEFGQLQAI